MGAFIWYQCILLCWNHPLFKFKKYLLKHITTLSLSTISFPIFPPTQVVGITWINFHHFIASKFNYFCCLRIYVHNWDGIWIEAYKHHWVCSYGGFWDHYDVGLEFLMTWYIVSFVRLCRVVRLETQKTFRFSFLSKNCYDSL